MAAQNKQTHFFHGTNKFPWNTQRTVHLLQIIFNFLFCPVPIRYSTEIFSKFFHLPPPICIQLPCSLYRPGAWSLLSMVQNTPTCTLSKLYVVLLSVRGCASFSLCSGGVGLGFWFDVFWLWPGTPAPLSLSLRFSAGWSISWLMTQQMFTGQRGNLFPFSWPLQQWCREYLHMGRRTTTHLSSIITKSYLGKQFHWVSSVLIAFKMTSHFPCKRSCWTLLKELILIILRVHSV